MMGTILIRFAELGLKSEKVRTRFLKHLADDIEESLIDAKVEHLLEVQRSRIFLETDQIEMAEKVLKQVPGIYSFSAVLPASSDMDEMMGALSEFGRSRIEQGMTYGLKVRRTGKHNYSSHDIAVEGGGAVVAHLKEGDARVDLKDPDIWIEVEIRDSKAYIFDGRVKGMGGMPASSQGKVILYLPSPEKDIVERCVLSFILMRRRGCKVIPASFDKDKERWTEEFGSRSLAGGSTPFILYGEDLTKELESAASKLKVWGVVYPSGPGEEALYPLLHSGGAAISHFYPTISMDMTEVGEWIARLNG